MKNLFLITIAGILTLLLTSGCLRYEGTNRGKVIDEATGEPIEGVVILAVWKKGQPTIAGTKHKFYDAMEVVTDKDGEFSIEGMGLKLDRPGLPFPGFADIENMQIFIFKAGYTYDHIVDLDYEKAKYKWRFEDDKVIIRLKKLTMEERRRKGPPSRPSIPIEKMNLLTKEVNKERIELGLTPFELGGNAK